MYTASPNPASQDLIIEQTELKIEPTDIDSEEEALAVIEAHQKLKKVNGFEISVFDDFGQQVFYEFIKNKKTELDLRKYPKGIYILKISDGLNVNTHRIVVDH